MGKYLDSIGLSHFMSLIKQALAGKSDTGHTHAADDVASGTFDAARIPNLAISKITNLQTTLDGKQPAGDYWVANKDGTSYWGLHFPNDTSNDWMRTTQSGIIPYANGGGSSSLGTASWPFSNIYGQAVYCRHNTGDVYVYAERTDTAVKIGMGVGGGGTNHGLWSFKLGQWLIYGNATDVVMNGINYSSQTANKVLASPSGSTGKPTFRELVAADIPTLSASKIKFEGYSWVSGATPTSVNISSTAYTSAGTTGWTYYKYIADGASMVIYHAFGVVKFKNTAITTAHGSGYINAANLYIRLPKAARVIKSATFGTAMGGGLLGVTLLAAGGTGDWKSTSDSIYNLPVRLFSPVSQAASNSNNDNQFIPVDIWFTATG